MKQKRLRAFSLPFPPPPPTDPSEPKSKKCKKEKTFTVEMKVTLPREGEEEEMLAGMEEEDGEEALAALMEHQIREVGNLRYSVKYYTSQLKEAEERLLDTERKLARLRDQHACKDGSGSSGTQSKHSVDDRLPTKQNIFIPLLSNHGRIVSEAAGQASPQASTAIVLCKKPLKPKGTKLNLELGDHQDLIPIIRSNSSRSIFRWQTSSLISNQHRRRMRSIALCPGDDNLFATSALDGMLNIWQIQEKGSVASLLSATDCVSPVQRRWPEDIAWHPHGDSILCAYSADGGDYQISVLDLNDSHRRARVTFLEEKPHAKGIINSIAFLPREDNCFITGGADHAVILWNAVEDGNLWKSKALHKTIHSSAVMGVAGMLQKNVVLTVGADRRIVGFDIQAGTSIFMHQTDNKCMSVLPNPRDFNLFMVQTGAAETQLRLFDIRLRQREVHAFGWTQESSESQSALINQAWSPDGLFISSGSADPMIHIFDIRCNAQRPSQSVKAHQKRVFKAAWHRSLPLLISISSDLNIGMHKIA